MQGQLCRCKRETPVTAKFHSNDEPEARTRAQLHYDELLLNNTAMAMESGGLHAVQMSQFHG
jgi:hypothetical protein